MEGVGVPDLVAGGHHLGQRRCPNPHCHSHIFCVINGNSGEALKIYPPLRIDFDSSHIPDEIVETLTEAITCHAEGCYKAAAIMVRRTLEELCEQNEAEGKDLKKRIESLKNKLTVPKALIDGLDNLRLLGNDAAHIEAKIFAQIGEEEVRLAIDVTKELLKAIYQYESLIERMNQMKQETLQTVG